MSQRSIFTRASCRLRRIALRPIPARLLLSGHNKLHLGCGGHIMTGWANIGLDGPSGVIRYNLTRPLPIRSGSVRFIYSEHFIEHITRDEGLTLFEECHRVLTPGGVLRLSTPDLRKLLDEYILGRTTEWTEMSWRPETPCRMVNEGMRLWGHQFLYDEEEMARALSEVGFNSIRRMDWGDSFHAELRGIERRPDHGELIIEAIK